MEQQERKSAMPELERFIRSMGMTEGQAMQLMTGAVKHQAQMMRCIICGEASGADDAARKTGHCGDGSHR